MYVHCVIEVYDMIVWETKNKRDKSDKHKID